MKKTGRNDPCPCGSGKKFKKCCESKMIGKRFMAKKIEDTAIVEKPLDLSSLFEKSVPLPTQKESVPMTSHDVKIKEGKKEENDIPPPEKAEEKKEEEEKTPSKPPQE